ncbi:MULTISPECIES: DUF2502 domain-containing protein [unclassified Brenneria]|uniref:DUF2502 domain-containing protein n=1 Tax=unclassified Brenneria TaxID=2634434 RepID=UPI0018F0828E|nr:DUF2502 domain-containing protein [Brenneria sp. L3-3C-1]MBJ7223682.1 DUF2502 domain-containing protein [Brenneria sp. L3-3C-1]MEE3644924.1 DUF2502 domain-containing protein [Brenneria sp. L3_3C_1]
MFKPLLVSTLLVGMFAMTPAAQADSISIDILPGVTLNIGDRDRRGYYWDGYDWRSERWWREHRGAYRGERNRHGHYWDGWRWRDVGWWREHQRGPRHFDDRRAYREHYRDDRGPRWHKKRDRDDWDDDWDDD